MSKMGPPPLTPDTNLGLSSPHLTNSLTDNPPLHHRTILLGTNKPRRPPIRNQPPTQPRHHLPSRQRQDDHDREIAAVWRGAADGRGGEDEGGAEGDQVRFYGDGEAEGD